MIVKLTGTKDEETKLMVRYIIEGDIKGSFYIPLKTFKDKKKQIPKKIKIKTKLW